MVQMKKVIVATLLVVPILLGLVTSSVSAQSINDDYEKTVSDKNTSLEKTTFNIIDSTIRSLVVQTGGCSSQNCPIGLSGDLTDGATQSMGKMIGMTYYKPADTKTYVASVLEDMQIVKPAYAQGLGFSSLTPLLEIWKLFRNIAYIFFVLIFLIIGFAIMLRQNLGGQAAVTIQQALPRIIVALLMVTFSYAIAGLLIDIMYIVMFFLVAMFSQTNLLKDTLTDFGSSGNILNQNIFQIYFGIITNDFAGRSAGIIGKFVQQALTSSGSEVQNALASFAQGLTNVLGTLIIFFVILFAMFRTFFSLAKVYIEIIFSIAFAPVILMMGAIQSNVFGNWVKGLAANLAVFPAMLVFIIIGYLLVGTPPDSISTSNNSFYVAGQANAQEGSLPNQLNDGGFVPPFFPGRGVASQVGLVAGIGAIMLLPEVAGLMGKFKPRSIFEDLGGNIFNQVKTANRFAMPVAGVAVGGPANVLAQGASGAWKNLRQVAPAEPGGRVGLRTYAGAIGRGFRDNFTRNNLQAGIGTGFQLGSKLVKQEENILEGRLQDANNFESYIMNATEKAKREKAAEEAARRRTEESQPEI